MTETHITPIETTDEVVSYEETPAGPDHRAHMFAAGDNLHVQSGQYMEPQDIVDLARLSDIEIVAMCGHRLIPRRNPKVYPVCEACVDEAERRIMGGGV